MGKIFEQLDDALCEFLQSHAVFFAASAPSGDAGHINVSPKGLDSFRILGPTEVAYLDLLGSGIETVAHVRENGRIVLMFCAFSGPPRILRLWGRARVVEPEDPEYAGLQESFDSPVPARSIIVLKITRIQESCGYGVPVLEYTGDRQQLEKWGRQKSAGEIEAYKTENNARSIDGLPGLRSRCP